MDYLNLKYKKLIYMNKLIQEVMTEALWANKPFGMGWSN